MVTVRSLPGAVSAVSTTDVMFRPMMASACNGPSAKPSTSFETVAPVAMVSSQYDITVLGYLHDDGRSGRRVLHHCINVPHRARSLHQKRRRCVGLNGEWPST